MMNVSASFLAISLLAPCAIGCGSPSADSAPRNDVPEPHGDVASTIAQDAATTAKNLLMASQKNMAQTPASSERTTFDRHAAGYLTPTFARGSRRGQQKRLDIEIPTLAADWTRVSASNLGVAFRVPRAGAVAAQQVDDMIVYPLAYATGASMMQMVQSDRLEDFVLFDKKPENETLVYQIQMNGVAGLRLVSNTLEFLDSSGTPQLRIAPPRVYASVRESDKASTNVFPAKLAVRDCSIDTSPAPPWGRKPVAPCSTKNSENACECTVVVDWSGQTLQYPLLVDPAWVATSSMVELREDATTTKLPDGRVLVAGGIDRFYNTFKSAEIFDPASGTDGTWAAVADMNDFRHRHASVLLDDGTVLVTGGYGVGADYMSAVEQFQASTGEWLVRAPMPAGRYWHTATRLDDGRVLIAGGRAGLLELPTFIWDPGQDSWYTPGGIKYARIGHTATKLDDGRVVIIGGRDFVSNDLGVTEVFDPITDQWHEGPELVFGRHWHASILEPNHRILVIGGRSVQYSHRKQVERCNFDDGNLGCSETPSLNVARSEIAAVRLSNGFIMAIGGVSKLETLSSIELFDPNSETWSLAGEMLDRRSGPPAAIRLDDDSVVIATGYMGSMETGGAERWYPQSNGIACISGGECQSGHCVDGLCCNVACPGVCNACNQAETGLPDGTCGPVEQHPCGNYQCLFPSGDCANPCTKNEHCMDNFVCSSGMTCVPAVPLCDDNRVIHDDDSTENCGDYSCNPTDGKCLVQCRSSGDCWNDTDCNLKTNRCIPRAAAVDEDSGCACSMHRRDNANAWGILILMAGICRWTQKKRST